jgi:hypothetical protein
VCAVGACQEVTFVVQDDGLVGLDGVQVAFDDERVVSDAGVMLVATLAQRLGIEALARDLVRLRRDRPGAANAGRKMMALLFAMVLGADSIYDADVLRAGRTRRLLGGWLPAPSTLGTCCAPSRSGMCASSTGCSERSSMQFDRDEWAADRAEYAACVVERQPFQGMNERAIARRLGPPDERRRGEFCCWLGPDDAFGMKIETLAIPIDGSISTGPARASPGPAEPRGRPPTPDTAARSEGGSYAAYSPRRGTTERPGA